MAVQQNPGISGCKQLLLNGKTLGKVHFGIIFWGCSHNSSLHVWPGCCWCYLSRLFHQESLSWRLRQGSSSRHLEPEVFLCPSHAPCVALASIWQPQLLRGAQIHLGREKIIPSDTDPPRNSLRKSPPGQEMQIFTLYFTFFFFFCRSTFAFTGVKPGMKLMGSAGGWDISM